MTFEVPDIDIDNSTIEELKAHSLLVAGIDNKIRTHHISVLVRIIALANEKHEAAYVYPIDRQPPRKLQVTRVPNKSRYATPAKKIVLDAIDEEYSLDDFK